MSAICISGQTRVAQISAAGFAALVVFLGSPCRADDSVTLQSNFDPIIADGQLVGCGIAFDVVRMDPDYFNGANVHASGSLYVFSFPGKKPGVGLKLGVGPPGVKGVELHPPKALFLVNGYRTNSDEQVTENPGEAGHELASFSLRNETFAAIVRAEETGRFSVGYAMEAGGRSDIFDVDMSVGASDYTKSPPSVTHDASTVPTWKSCVDDLLKRQPTP